MALQLILGNAGAGKSHYIFEKIIQESMEHPTKQYLIIVPEQFTMQTQKDLVMSVWHTGSFQRWAASTGRFWKIRERAWCFESWRRRRRMN